MRRAAKITVTIFSLVVVLAIADGGWLFYKNYVQQQEQLALARQQAKMEQQRIEEMTRKLVRPKLDIQFKGVGTEVQATPGTKGVVLARMEAKATGSDIYIKSMELVASNGALDSYKTFGLRIDTDGDGVVDSKPAQSLKMTSNTSFTLLASGTGVWIPNGKTVVIEVQYDVPKKFNKVYGAAVLVNAQPFESYIEAATRDGKALEGIQTTEWDGGKQFTNGNCSIDGCDITVATARWKMLWVTDQAQK